MGRQRPGSVSLAIRVQAALVGVGALLTVATVVMREDLLQAWVDSNDTAREIVAEGGMDALRDSAITVPSFAPVGVVTFLVYGLLAWVLTMVFREGHAWGRWSLLALAAAHLFATVVLVRADLPVPFLVLAAAGALLDVVLGWLLLQRDTTEWIRGFELAEEQPAG